MWDGIPGPERWGLVAWGISGGASEYVSAGPSGIATLALKKHPPPASLYSSRGGNRDYPAAARGFPSLGPCTPRPPTPSNTAFLPERQFPRQAVGRFSPSSPLLPSPSVACFQDAIQSNRQWKAWLSQGDRSTPTQRVPVRL